MVELGILPLRCRNSDIFEARAFLIKCDGPQREACKDSGNVCDHCPSVCDLELLRSNVI